MSHEHDLKINDVHNLIMATPKLEKKCLKNI